MTIRPPNSFLRPRLKQTIYTGVCAMPGCEREWESTSYGTQYCDNPECNPHAMRKLNRPSEAERTYPKWDSRMANKWLFMALRRRQID